MRPKTRLILLAVYGLLLAVGAIWQGLLMIAGSGPIYGEFPKEWLAKVPFTSWVAPGIIAISFFGLGNLLASAYCLLKKGGKPWVASAAMGAAFFLSLIAQVIILGETYLATVCFFFLSIVQLNLCGFAALGLKKQRNVAHATEIPTNPV